MGDKRGFSHLEMVLSFLFFISFVSFLLFVLSPFSVPSLSYSVVDSFVGSFSSELGVDFSELFVSVTLQSGGTRCFEVNLPNNGVSDIRGNVLSVELKTGNTADVGEAVSSHIEGDSLFIEPRDKSSGTHYFRVFFSEDFPDTSQLNNCDVIIDDDVYLRNPRSESFLSFSKLADLKLEYDNDYGGVKSRLGFPLDTDFSLTSPDLPLTHQLDRSPPFDAEVNGEFFVLPVLKSDGSIINARFLLSVW